MNRPPRESGLLWPALWRMAVAGAAFVIIYGGCNHITASRDDVGTWMWDWERHIPFVREMVVPYWSLDLFFCGAFLLCASRLELNLLTRRLIAVTVLSGICFLLFPLKLALPRPEPEGWTAPLFLALYANDKPFNMAPSLHISLRSLVWVFYGALLRGWLRRVTKVWFILIGASTLLVWQHHVIDVATGFLMGWLVAALIPDPRQHARGNASSTLAWRYGAGAAACAALAVGWFGFAWPAASLGIISLAYATGRPGLLGKENGTLSPSAEWCLLPALVVTRLIQRKWWKHLPARVEITPGVSIGRMPSASDALAMTREGPLAVLDLTPDSNAPVCFREHAIYRNVPMLDLVQPCDAALRECMDFIREHAERRPVFIHCQLGLQRSAAVALRWLTETQTAGDENEARRILQSLQPGAKA